MSLTDQVEAAFDQESWLAQSVPSFLSREGQTDMARAVAHTISEGGVLVVEAGTGVGKTFAYLVPVLLSGVKVILSTATKNLQDQLFGRDLPRLIAALGLPVQTALLKGRSSYLCHHRLTLARQDHSMSSSTSARALGRIEVWAQSTRSGDLAELPGLDERSPLIPLVTSTRDNCLGTPCPSFRNCHVNLARREAMAADVVVINHHLFFADLAVRESGVAELLPAARCVVFDEAHQLNETGVQFLGRHLSSAQVLEFGRDMLACGLQQARGLVDWAQCASVLERAARDLRLCAGKTAAGAKLNWTEEVPQGVDALAWQDALEQLASAAVQSHEGLIRVQEMSPDLVRLTERAHDILSHIDFFRQACAHGSVRWVDVGTHLRLVESPLDIAQAVQEKLLGAPVADAPPKSWIFTSATLGDEGSLNWFTEPCGLEQATVLRVQSPFDYPNQAAVYVPRTLVKPADPRHSDEVAALVARLSVPLGGRTLVLTTTLRALRAISEALAAQLSTSPNMEVLSQGQLPKRELMARFLQGHHEGEKGCVLVASASFWEGVDIPGDALQMVVIDKLPFPPPNDPLVQARTQRLEANGRSPFNDYFIPEAAVALKQGAGRLIRRETDSGLLVICDTRLASMGYGRRLLAALPPMRQLKSEDEALNYLDTLTKVSTTAPTSF